LGLIVVHRYSGPPEDANKLYAVIDYPDSYVQPLLIKGLEQMKNLGVKHIASSKDLPAASDRLLQIAAYEQIDFEQALDNSSTSFVCAYIIRKALIRKHYLSNTISTWLVKHPGSVLAKSFKASVHFELDYAEFLDEALFDAWDLNESMEKNEALADPADRSWWILKPGMSDGGNGIRMFTTFSELQAIFEEWEVEDPDNEADENDEPGENETDDENGNPGRDADGTMTADEGGAMTSQLRHFIAQPYIPDPLLLSNYANRKFHIRTYVVAVGALRVYVSREMLALFAAKPYSIPTGDAHSIALDGHLTNTCFQDESTKHNSVHRFWALQAERSDDWQDKIFSDICETVGEVFEAAAREQMIHFQTLPNAFEIFGVDFLVDEALNVWLLELNAYPDFKQTGASLQEMVVGSLFEEVMRVAVAPFFDRSCSDFRNGTDALVLVRELDLGRG
jgi:tubulin---tyrosine ligase